MAGTSDHPSDPAEPTRDTENTRNKIEDSNVWAAVQAHEIGTVNIGLREPRRTPIRDGIARTFALTRAVVRRFRPRRAIVTVSIVVVVVLVATVWYELRGGDGRPDSGQLARIAAPLRTDCRIAPTESGFRGASAVLNCRADDQNVQISLFNQPAALDDAYADAIHRSGVRSGSGDCTVGPDGEHRYPSEGTATGRVLCYQRDGQVTYLWSNERARTLAKVVEPNLNAGLAQSWSAWAGLPAFPTRAESAVIAEVDLRACQRPAAGTLDGFTGLKAAVTCASPDAGVTTISYYGFTSAAALAQAQTVQESAVNAPAGVDCTGTTRGFLGEESLNLRGADVGTMLCYLDAHKTPVLQWSLAPLRLLVRVTGTTPSALMDWWRGYFGFAAPTDALVAAVNRQARPAFPTAPESTLLAHIPPASRVGCMRVSDEQIAVNVGDIPVTAAITCGPTRGADIVFYYQFRDPASMGSVAVKSGIDAAHATGPACTDEPRNFSGAAPYTSDARSGVLGCGTNSNGPFLLWSDQRLDIIGMAFGGSDPPVLLDWWRNQAGPN